MTSALILPLIVLIYLRVSTEDQATKGYSLPEQRESCQAKAQALAKDLESESGQTVDLHVHEIVDDFGGDVIERPALEEARMFVKQFRPRYFVCMNPDRFSRKLMLQMIITDEIKSAGSTLAYTEYSYSDDPEGELQYQVRGAVSEFEKKQILKRTMRGKQRKLKEGGRPNGASPFGYHHDKLTDELSVHEEEAQWVRQIFAWNLEGEGIHTITRHLNEMGIPTRRGKKTWQRSVVRGILRNSSYMGEMACNQRDFRGLGSVSRLPRSKRQALSAKKRPRDEWVIVQVPPIVSRSVWDTVQGNLDRSRRGGERNTGMLSMLMRCGVCGGHAIYARHSKTGITYARCRYKYAKLQGFRKPDCTAPHWRAEQVEETVWSQLRGALMDPSAWEYRLRQRKAGGGSFDRAASLADQLERLNGQIRERRTEQALVIQKQAKGLLSDEAADELLDRIKAELKATTSETAQVESDLSRVRAASSVDGVVRLMKAESERVRAYGLSVEKWLDSLTLAHRRELVLRLVDHVTIEAADVVHVEYRGMSV